MDETWMIFILTEAGLRTKDVSGLAREQKLRTKETCFGALAEGEAGDVRRFVVGLRQAYGGSVYAKRRAFSIEDTAVCASTFRFEAGTPPWLPRYTGQIRRYTS